MKLTRADRAAARRAGDIWFDGVVWELELNRAEDDRGLEVWAIWFDPGARTRPHVHSVDQALHALEGTGVVATQDEHRIMRPGDWLVVPAGKWHWHGATPDNAFCHISILKVGENDLDQPLHDWGSYMEGLSAR